MAGSVLNYCMFQGAPRASQSKAARRQAPKSFRKALVATVGPDGFRRTVHKCVFAGAMPFTRFTVVDGGQAGTKDQQNRRDMRSLHAWEEDGVRFCLEERTDGSDVLKALDKIGDTTTLLKRGRGGIEKRLQSFVPITGPLRQLDDEDISQVLQAWMKEFDDEGEAELLRVVDPVTLQLADGPDPDWGALYLAQEERFLVIPLWLTSYDAILRGNFHSQAVKEELERVGGDYSKMDGDRIDRALRAMPGHWVLVIADTDFERLYLVDSLHSPHYRYQVQENWRRKPGNPLMDYACWDWQPRGLPQGDSFSCGYRVLTWIRYLLLHFGGGGVMPHSRMPEYPLRYPERKIDVGED